MTTTAEASQSAPAQSPKPTLVFAHTTRCGRSRKLEAYLAQILQRRHNHDTFTMIRVDVEKRPVLAERLHVERTPTLLVIDEGRVCARLTDPTGRAPIEKMLARWLK
jgi:thioredoxin-like negative regulator of GroEL